MLGFLGSVLGAGFGFSIAALTWQDIISGGLYPGICFGVPLGAFAGWIGGAWMGNWIDKQGGLLRIRFRLSHLLAAVFFNSIALAVVHYFVAPVLKRF